MKEELPRMWNVDNILCEETTPFKGHGVLKLANGNERANHQQ
jgi:hypothetical protein